MADIALFPSVLGVRKGVARAGEILTRHGHQVTIVDLYDGWAFDDFVAATEHAESIGRERLRMRALAGVKYVPDGFIAAGFSMGAGIAEYVATRRDVSSVLLFSGAESLANIGVEEWPVGVDVQHHAMVEDPLREGIAITRLERDVEAAGATFGRFEYPGSKHLFMDSSIYDEYDAQATELLWRRVIDHCAGYRLSAA